MVLPAKAAGKRASVMSRDGCEARTPPRPLPNTQTRVPSQAGTASKNSREELSSRSRLPRHRWIRVHSRVIVCERFLRLSPL